MKIKTIIPLAVVLGVIMLPLLFWAFLSMFSIFDAFRQYSINQKVAYTIGDMISRQTSPIDAKYLEGAQKLFDYLTFARGDSALRVTSVLYDADSDSYKSDWSKTRGAVLPAGQTEVTAWYSRLPVMPADERVMVVETWKDYTAPFATGLEKRTISNFVFTRPRYAPQVLWSDGTGS